MRRALGRILRETDERIGGWVARMERSEQHFIEALAENSAEIKEMSEGNRRMWESIDDMRESIQANTRAVLSVLDRMDRLDGGSAA